MESSELRVLLIEDSNDDVELTLHHLRRAQRRCQWLRVETEDGFRRALREFRPEVILSDFSLPQFDGLEALRIAATEAPEIPFLFLSGTIGEERAIEALKRGAVDYVLKSNLARLSPAVTRALEEAASRRARRVAEEQVRRLTRVLEMLCGISSAAMRIRGRDELLREACRLAVRRGGYAGAVVTLKDPRLGMIRPVAWDSVDAHVMPSYAAAPTQGGDTTIAAEVVRTGSVFVCNDIARMDPRYVSREALLEAGYTGIVSLPLSVDATPVGALAFATVAPGGVSDKELPLLREVAANLSFALQYLEKDDTVRFLSYFDPLTGLARRALFCERLERQLESSPPVPSRSVVVLDIERLAAINDTMGRHVADMLLQHAADRLKRYFGDTDRMAHFGGGTFALSLPQAESVQDPTRAVHEHLDSVFGRPFRIEGHEISLATRFGLASFPENGRHSEELVGYAEAALQDAKKSGEKYLHRRLKLTSELARQLALEQRLRRALEGEQFVLHYQPKLDMRTLRVRGVEALLRWNDPAAGLVFPSEFLPVLESTGMLAAVGQWVVRQAVADCRRWHGAGLAPVRVAVNVAPQQLRRPQFAEQFLETATAGMPPGFGIDIEITEGTLHDDASLGMQNLKTLRSAGVPIAIDDFGTGYSSLSRISRLPVDTLKIDRSFVIGLPDDRASMAIVSMIVGLARTFGLTTIAEGVETPVQFDLLRQAGCDQSQGYFHSRPVPCNELQSLLSADAGARD